jgi:hypothetical protein
MNKAKKINWVCTDSDTKQYGMHIQGKIYAFKEGIGENRKESLIDLNDYSIPEQESHINSFGYTLLSGENKNPRLLNIYEEYGKQAEWIIAECIFEMED